MRLFVAIIVVGQFLAQTITLAAQELLVRFETTKADLYLGYVNEMRISIIDEDTANIYNFHAKAVGADINYKSNGEMAVLPFQKNGHVEIYGELKGVYYAAGRIRFEGIKPPPLTNGIFVEVMGITQDDPKTKLPAKKQFDPGTREIRQSRKISIGAFPISDLRSDAINVVRVAILRPGVKYYTPMKGKIEVLSKDARIRKVDDITFNIEPLAGKSRCVLSVFLDGRKISDERMHVFSRE